MKKLLIFCILFINFISFSQSFSLDGYRFVYINKPIYEGGQIDIYGLEEEYSSFFREMRITSISDNQYDDFVESGNFCQLLTVDIKHVPKGRWKQTVTLSFKNCLGETVHTLSANAGNDMSSPSRDIVVAGKKVIEQSFKKWKFNSTLTPKMKDYAMDFSSIGLNFDVKSENEIKNHFDLNGYKHIEGIWGVTDSSGPTYKLAIFYFDDKYYAIVVDDYGLWKKGEVKAEIETAAVDEVVTISWFMGDKVTNLKAVGTVENSSIIKFKLSNDESGESMMYRSYPKINKNNSISRKKSTNSESWRGNGSGLIISKSGYIVTNNHVIEDAEKIEIQFILNNEVQNFNAEIVQVDKINDLAIIKIFDMNFDGVDELPYNFKIKSSDVGTKVYAYGYPLALSLMGKEIKVTDGMISSKSGFEGNVTTYQITAPVQGGNSGGPLFDEKGNLLGINSSKISEDIAENVAYTIKTSYIINLLDVLPRSIEIPSNKKLELLPLTEQIKEISKYVVLIKVK